MSFDFMNMGMPITPNGLSAPIPAQVMQNPQMIQQQMSQQPKIDPRMFDTPKITTGTGIKFTITDKENKDKLIPVDLDVPTKTEKQLPRRKKETSEIIRSTNSDTALSGTVEDIPTAYTYLETTSMLRDTLSQIDGLNTELMQEFENVRASRTLKNKHNVMIGLSENVGALISNKISAIKEINNSITKSNDLDYKKIKDSKAAMGNVDDDKRIADLYTAFITNPQAQMQQVQVPMMDMTAYGSTGIVRADISNNGNILNSNGQVDMSYSNYVANASPEQRLMMMEGNNSIKQCIIYDASTGNKAFQYFDMQSMQPVPNMPIYSDILLEEFQIDLTTRTAKSINLKETMPVIVINDNITSQY